MGGVPTFHRKSDERSQRMKARRTWIVVADGARARIFLAERLDHPWQVVAEQEHPESRARTPELVTDMPALERGTLPKEREAELFAREIAEQLERAFHAHQFQRLVLVAPPEMMGYLRNALPDTVAAVVTDEITKDFSQLREDELQERVGL
jgi:protein required for attachment to host cells